MTRARTLLLALETSTRRGGVALLEGDRLLAREENLEPRRHAEWLVGAIERALVAAGRPREAIGALACGVGPGSFTGARVALATAKGLALGLGVPIVGVGSLEAMAAAALADPAAGSDAGTAIALLDAHKGEVFLAAYAADGTCLAPPDHVAREDAEEATLRLAAGGRVVVAGEVAETLPALAPLLVRAPACDLPDPRWIGRLGARRLDERPDGDELAGLDAVYVRPPDARPMAPS